MRMLTAEEHRDALLNLAVPSPILRETEPILRLLLLLLDQREKTVSERVLRDLICEVEQVEEMTEQIICNLRGHYSIQHAVLCKLIQ